MSHGQTSPDLQKPLIRVGSLNHIGILSNYDSGNLPYLRASGRSGSGKENYKGVLWIPSQVAAMLCTKSFDHISHGVLAQKTCV